MPAVTNGLQVAVDFRGKCLVTVWSMYLIWQQNGSTIV